MAVRFRFTRDYDHPAAPGTDVAYKAGTALLVPEAHAAAAEAAGRGTRAEKPAKAKDRAERG